MDKYITKECKKHGLTKYVLEGRGYYRCTTCRCEAVSKRRKKLKRMAVEYKGGKCVHCGYNKCVEALEFHHNDGDKEFGIAAKGITRSFEAIKKEIDKCILICANCHVEEHVRLNIIAE